MKLFELFATLGLDTSGFDSGLTGAQSSMQKASKTIKSIGSGMVKVGKTVGSAASSIISGTEQAISSVATAAAGAATAVGAAAAAIAKSALDIRSSVEQGEGGAEAVFGQYAQRIKDWAEASWETAGLSMADYYETANKMGALFQGSGIEQYQATDMTIQAMQRAADVASIMGISVEDAMYSIAGLAKGNMTMMDNLGVPMNDTVLAAYALEKGMEKSVEQMTLAEKIELAMQKFMEDTAYAAGNYAKENDTMAGSITTLKAAWENFLAGNLSFDKVLDSAYSAMTIALKTLGLEAYQPFLDSAKETVDQVVDILGMEDGEVDENGLTKSEKLRQLFTDKFKTLFDDVAANAPTWIGNVFDAITTALGDVNTVLPSAMNMATTLFQALRDGFAKMKDPLLDGTETIAGDALAMFTTFKADMLTTGLEFIGAFAQGISDDLAKGDESSVKKALDEGIGNVINALSFSASTVLPAAKGLIQALAASLADPEVGTQLSTFVSDLIGDIGTLLVDKEFWSSLGNAVLNIGGGLLSGIFGGLAQAADNIWKALFEGDDESVPESVKALQKSFTDIMTNSKAAEDAYSSALGDIEARADLAEKYLAVLEAYEKIQDPDDSMVQEIKDATTALVALYPELEKYIDPETGMFDKETASIREYIKALQDLAKQRAYQQLMESSNETLANLFVTKTDTQAKINELEKNLAEQQRLAGIYADYAKNGAPQTITDAGVIKDMQERMDNFGELYEIGDDGVATATKLGTEAALYASAMNLLQNSTDVEIDTLTDGIADLQQTMSDIDTAIAETQANAQTMIDTFNSLYGTATEDAGTATEAANGLKTALDSIEGTYTANIVLNTDGTLPDGTGDKPQTYNASGLKYVPYDNYISRLHRGEMVLTRQQADTYRQGSSGGRQYAVSASLNVGSMTLNNGMDAQRVAQALSKETTRQVRALGRRKG